MTPRSRCRELLLRINHVVRFWAHEPSANTRQNNAVLEPKLSRVAFPFFYRFYWSILGFFPPTEHEFFATPRPHATTSLSCRVQRCRRGRPNEPSSPSSRCSPTWLKPSPAEPAVCFVCKERCSTRHEGVRAGVRLPRARASALPPDARVSLRKLRIPSVRMSRIRLPG